MQSPAIKQALGILKQLRQITESSEDVAHKLADILKTIAEAMQADAAVCYAVVDKNYLDLFSTYGLEKTKNKRTRSRFGEGTIGQIANDKRSLALNNLWMYPKFAAESELVGKDYKSFMGAPILQWNRTVGVLAIYHCAETEYSDVDIELLETIAMFLAEIMSSTEMSEYKKSLSKSRGLATRDRMKGVSLSKGYGIGTAIVHKRRQSVTNIFAEDKDKELLRLQVAYQQMNEDLENKFASTKLGLGEHVEILDAYRMFAKDKGWYGKIERNINNGLSAEAAVERAYEDMWNRLSQSSDVYMRERLHDLRDVSDRLLSYLLGENKKTKVIDDKDIVIVAQTMGPAELMDYDYGRIRGLILEDGTPTMHVAIVAKTLNIPVLSKIKGIFTEIHNGQTVAVDGNEGWVYVNPSKHVADGFRKKVQENIGLAKKWAALRNLPSVTKDKQKIGQYLNVGLPLDFDYIETTNCDGVGLYRTEIPFMASETMPDVNRQVAYYKDLITRSGDKKVIFRSLDVGSDKLLPYWAYSGEANPAIGWRSIRITLDRRVILRQQIRAFLQAAVGHELNVMFPMISDYAEFIDAKETLMLELEKEKKKGMPVPKKINVGLMIEVPSVLFQLDEILPEADFVSVGTNDLAQFIFACDRGNPKLLDRYDVLSAPFLSVMKTIVDKAKQYGVYCSVCGEMASNPIEALALIGLGYRNLSSNGASFGRIKGMIRSINCAEVADYMQNLLKSPRASVRSQLISYANDHGIEIY
ncbi:MAG: phosphoenolpyruvate--protein phosphotransferase [Rhodospirillales bacterium]|nr:phosphoenolpyruvate--protein phosphotransferase [Rhodospirillales bacterium]